MLMIRRQAAGGHDAVHVRMADERLAPRVEDAQPPDLRAQVAGSAATSRSVAALV